MKISPIDYQNMLLELAHMGKLLASLQMEEQKTAGILATRSTSHDIKAMAKLPKIRKDIANVLGIMEVQGNLVNAHIESTYQFEFQSFKTKDYADIINTEPAPLKIQESEDNLPGQEVRQQEGSESRSNVDIGDARVIDINAGAGN